MGGGTISIYVHVFESPLHALGVHRRFTTIGGLPSNIQLALNLKYLDVEIELKVSVRADEQKEKYTLLNIHLRSSLYFEGCFTVPL